MFRMDASGDEDYKKVGGGFSRLPAGRYHVEIVEVDESFQKNPDKVPITFEVLAGTNPGYEGKKHTEFFATSERSVDRLKRLALLCELIRPGEVKNVSFSQAIGATLVIEIVPHSYEKDGKTVNTTQLDYGGFWREDDIDVKDVPRGKSSPRQAKGTSRSEEQSRQGGSKWDNI